MIQNSLILEKLNAKTDGNEKMREFIKNVLTNEAEGKQYNKYFRAEIEKHALADVKKGGDN